MVAVKDILLKTSEQITPENWCALRWFDYSEDAHPHGVLHRYDDEWKINLEAATASSRCLDGAVALATAELGGTVKEYEQASNYLGIYLSKHADNCNGVVYHNDICILERVLSPSIDAEGREAVILELKDDVRKAAELLVDVIYE